MGLRVVHRAGQVFRRGIYFLQTGYLHTGERVNPDFNNKNFQNHFKVYQFLLQFVAEKDVLDVGCGTGYGSDYLGSTARSVIGIDLSPSAIRFARRRYRRAKFLRMDAHRLELPDKSVDCVVSTENLEHLANQDQHLAEVARVLRPDGMCFIATPNRTVYCEANQYHTREFNESELESFLRQRFHEVQVVGSLLRDARDKSPGAPGPLTVFGTRVDTTYQSNTHSLFSFARRPR